MSNVEAIKKALEELRQPKSMSMYATKTDMLADMMRERGFALNAIEALQRENESLCQSQSYTYIGRDGKSVLARDLEDRAEEAEAESKMLREALKPFSFDRSKINIERFDEDNQAWVAIDGAGPDRLMFFVRDILRARAALASAGEEHHAE